MEIGKKCYCLFATIATGASIILITAVFGYSMGSWNMATWISGGLIVAMVFSCTVCRMKDGKDCRKD